MVRMAETEDAEQGWFFSNCSELHFSVGMISHLQSQAEVSAHKSLIPELPCIRNVGTLLQDIIYVWNIKPVARIKV